MEIISLQFLAFVLIALLVYHFLPLQAQNIWLVIVSFAFLATWEISSALLLLVVTVATYWITARLNTSQIHKRRWLIAGVGLNLLFLMVYRLIDSEYFFTFSRLGGMEDLATQVNVMIGLLQIGLVFYSLQAIAYVVEAYNGRGP